MSATFQCGDAAALVDYLYDEGDPGDREAIAAHIARCAACASEVDALTATRQTLAAWTPPELALGFQISRAQDAAPANVLEHPAARSRSSWWQAPMPAWAQAAAALLIFAAGLSVGLTRTVASTQVATAGVASSAVPPPTATVIVSPNDLASLEARLKSEIAQMRTGAAPQATPVSQERASQDAVLDQMKTLLAESEERQRREFTLRMVDLASNIETQRRVDLTQVRQTMGVQQGVIGTELRQQREAIDRFNNYLVNVSERSR
jgi:anti-sigma factor RsiW